MGLVYTYIGLVDLGSTDRHIYQSHGEFGYIGLFPKQDIRSVGGERATKLVLHSMRE